MENMKEKQVLTITGIRPDFIRMSEIFKKLDDTFNHILIHTGQHYDKLLSEVFFEELEIRKPDYNLDIGGPGKKHYHQTADLSVKIIDLIENEGLKPDIILFLGDSNSVASSVALKKEGYTIGHIEAGMRSYDRRMLEEINRTVCDHCSDYLFVYHDDYRAQAMAENIKEENIFVVGNTIVEVANKVLEGISVPLRKNGSILMDIHRPENFNYKDRMKKILNFANNISRLSKYPVKMLGFNRTLKKIEEYGLDMGDIEVVPLMSYRDFMVEQYLSTFIISDSGTAQEEPCLLGTPVIVPRDFTERPQSVENNCSYMLNVDDIDGNLYHYQNPYMWAMRRVFNKDMSIGWLGDGSTSEKIINNLMEILK